MVWSFAQAKIPRRTFGSPPSPLPGSHILKEPFDISFERFLASLRFENRSKLDDLGLEIDEIQWNSAPPRRHARSAMGCTLSVGSEAVVSAAADDAFLPGINGGLGAVGQMQLAQDVADMSFDGVIADHQPL